MVKIEAHIYYCLIMCILFYTNLLLVFLLYERRFIHWDLVQVYTATHERLVVLHHRMEAHKILTYFLVSWLFLLAPLSCACVGHTLELALELSPLCVGTVFLWENEIGKLKCNFLIWQQNFNLIFFYANTSPPELHLSVSTIRNISHCKFYQSIIEAYLPHNSWFHHRILTNHKVGARIFLSLTMLNKHMCKRRF